MRKKLLIFGFWLLALVFTLNACTNPEIERAEREEIQKIINKVNDSKIIVLDIYHDRCKSCKYIEPIIKQLQTKYAGNTKLVFLKYDLSNFFTIYKSIKLAKKIGLEDIYKSQRYSGAVLIINTETKQVLDKLIGEYNLNKYLEKIEKWSLNET